jgi:antirestriction protein ArdC
MTRERFQPTGQHEERKEQASQLVADGFAGLVRELEQGRSERFLAYLAFCARFHHYSPHNQMLIWMQNPEASLVAGFGRWKQLGYRVRKGEKGIAILAPVLVKGQDETNPEAETLVGFKVVYVFDVTQLANTDEKPLPRLIERLPDDSEERFTLVRQAVEAAGIVVELAELTPGVHGASEGRRILLAREWDSRNRTLTLLHEWAHELLHRAWMSDEERRRLPRVVRECQAEAASYIVAQYLELYNPFSRDYLQLYGGTAQLLIDNLDQVQRASHHMIRALERQLGRL